MVDQSTQYRPDRHPAESYEDILDRDTRPVPPCLRQGPAPDLGDAGIPVTNYFDPDHFAREIRHVWLKVWQWACREEDIPDPGDVALYEIAGRSVIVARQTDGSIKAFPNSCLHRGRRLVDSAGNKPHFWCKYHGMSWTCAGAMRANPIAWDFPQFERRDTSLPELRVGCWGGFVFVNFDPGAAPLEKSLGPIVAHFAPYDLAGRTRAAHISKIVPCNWKVMAEAFMESHHTGATHPQIAAFLADVNSQYDILSDDVSRQFTAIAVPSPTLGARKLSEMAILQAMGAVSSTAEEHAEPEHMPTNARDTPKAPATLQQGQTARMYAAEAMRQALGAEDGFDYAGLSDAEMLDALLYNVFPHQSFWAGHAPTLVYRWRPNGLDPETSVMDVVILKRVPQGMARPKPAAEIALGLHQGWSEAAAILGAGLAAVFEQDMENMPAVQAGLRSSGTGVVHFGRYSEMRIRHMHQKIARMIAEGEAENK